MNEFRPQQTGTNPEGTVVPVPVGGEAFAPFITPQSANQTTILPVIDHRGYSGMLYVIRSDQSSAANGIFVEFSDDGQNWFSAGQPISYTQVNKQIQRALVPKGSYSRFTYINGSVAQGSFRFEVILTTANVQQTLSSLNIPITDTVLAAICKAVLEMPDDSGTYAPIRRINDSLKTYVANLPTDYAKEGTDSTTAPALYSGAAGTRGILSSIWQLLQNGFARFRLVDGNNNAVGVTNGALNVNVNNQTTAQSITGEVEIKNDTGSPIPVTVGNEVEVKNDAGTPLSIAYAPGFTYAEDTAATTGETLFMAGVVRKDTAGSTVDADGDRTELQVDNVGNLRTILPAATLTNIANTATALGSPADAAITDSTLTGTLLQFAKGMVKLLGGVLNVQGSLTTTSFAYTTKSYNYGTTPAVTTTATTGVQTIKSSAGAIGGIYAINTASADAFISFWDLPTATAITVGTTPPTFVQPIDANVPLTYTKDRVFNNSIRFAVTTTYAGANIISLVYLDIDFR